MIASPVTVRKQNESNPGRETRNRAGVGQLMPDDPALEPHDPGGAPPGDERDASAPPGALRLAELRLIQVPKPENRTRNMLASASDQVHDLELLPMRKAENREARRIIDAAAAVAVGIDEDKVADRGWRLAAEPAIYQRAGAFRQRETVHSLDEVPPSGLTTSSGRRPTKGPVGLGAPSSTSDLSGSPTHTRVLTPEHPCPAVELPEGPVLVAPLCLLYAYSFRPPHVGHGEVVGWARETAAVCSDEWVLYPEPFRDRDSWCAAPLGGDLGQSEVGAGCDSFSSTVQKRPGEAASQMERAT